MNFRVIEEVRNDPRHLRGAVGVKTSRVEESGTIRAPAGRSAMASVGTGSGDGAEKKRVDQEINMIPFIDLLLVTISFLLLTAVWTSLARLDAGARAPGSSTESRVTTPKDATPAVLHVRVSGKDHKFHLQWQADAKVDDLADVEMDTDASGSFAKLEDAIKKAYVVGQETEHLRGDDLSFRETDANAHGGNASNPAILHVDNALAFHDVVHVIDAIDSARRFVCFEPSPTCCGRPSSDGRAVDRCETAATDVPAFTVSFSSN